MSITCDHYRPVIELTQTQFKDNKDTHTLSKNCLICIYIIRYTRWQLTKVTEREPIYIATSSMINKKNIIWPMIGRDQWTHRWKKTPSSPEMAVCKWSSGRSIDSKWKRAMPSKTPTISGAHWQCIWICILNNKNCSHTGTLHQESTRISLTP